MDQTSSKLQGTRGGPDCLESLESLARRLELTFSQRLRSEPPPFLLAGKQGTSAHLLSPSRPLTLPQGNPPGLHSFLPGRRIAHTTHSHPPPNRPSIDAQLARPSTQRVS